MFFTCGFGKSAGVRRAIRCIPTSASGSPPLRACRRRPGGVAFPRPFALGLVSHNESLHRLETRESAAKMPYTNTETQAGRARVCESSMFYQHVPDYQWVLCMCSARRRPPRAARRVPLAQPLAGTPYLAIRRTAIRGGGASCRAARGSRSTSWRSAPSRLEGGGEATLATRAAAPREARSGGSRAKCTEPPRAKPARP